MANPNRTIPPRRTANATRQLDDQSARLERMRDRGIDDLRRSVSELVDDDEAKSHTSERNEIFRAILNGRIAANRSRIHGVLAVLFFGDLVDEAPFLDGADGVIGAWGVEAFARAASKVSK